ncbi:ABC transporter permease subunit [Bacillus sp. Ab-1751]|uniref:ABC transporter permease subunit n=1 Tax=Bacillus TaxID=1386 RepID=UPI00142240E9|nr:ABC transporter permease subunit [Bacillus sp. Ab-1751]
MKRFFSEKMIEFLICIVVIIIMSYLPFIFLKGNTLSFFAYLQQLCSPADILYFNRTLMRQVPFLENILDPYVYSLIILAASTCLAILFSTCLSFFYLLSSSRIRKGIERCLIFIESIPDLLLIFVLQLFFVWVFKQTGLNIVNIYAMNDKQVYFLPILCMTIVPMLHFFRIMVLFLLDEKNKPYVEFARAKGLSNRYILYVHLFRNVMYHLLNHLQSIFLFMISSLLMVEAAFNIHGYMSFLVKPGALTPLTMAWWTLLLFTPFYLIFITVHYQVNRITGGVANES